ncbi:MULTISPECIES: hypothetical protein [Mameliella]|uniref:hypothetical protein n=1 Tax=Mameliella TaxID=1434019 RepID=UPI000B532250|nr:MULTISPECIES: hypothetical protein [Mameliella]MCR9274577.1 hypothetical protein [Paracoccaceae bacterium]OWV60156.1 hypothetical protein CDZ98_09965 [Mameliella alba]
MPDRDDLNAKSIYDDLLHRAQGVIRTRDFDGYQGVFDLPFRLVNLDAAHVFSTPDDLRMIFETIQHRIFCLNLSSYFAVCLDAQRIDETTIVATHETRMITDNLLVGDPVPSVAVLKHVRGQWLLTEVWNFRPDRFGTSFLRVEQETRPAAQWIAMQARVYGALGGRTGVSAVR